VRAVLDDDGQPFRAADPGAPTPEERRRYAQALVDQQGIHLAEPPVHPSLRGV
jgi:DNA repair photolyase